MMTIYHETKLPARSYGTRTRVEVMSPGGAIVVRMHADKTAAPCQAELTPAEVKPLIRALVEALSNRCGMSFEQRNRFLQSMKV